MFIFTLVLNFIISSRDLFGPDLEYRVTRVERILDIESHHWISETGTEDNTIDLDSLMSLRSLSQLQHFGIGPEDKDGMAALDEDMTEGDFDRFITGFPSLIGFNFTLNHPLMVQSLSCLEKRCPKLRWITLGKCWDLSSLVSIPAPLFPNLHGMHVFLDEADIDRWATPAQLAGIIDNHAPKSTYFNVVTDGDYSLGLKEAWRALRGKYP